MTFIKNNFQGSPGIQSGEPQAIRRHVDLWDEGEAFSLVSMLHRPARESILEAKANQPELFSMEETALKKRLIHDGVTLTPIDHRLRVAFWVEYDRAITEERKLSLGNVWSGVCGHSHFHGNYMNSPHKVAWMLCPPSNYVSKISEMLDFGLDQLREILEMPNFDERGRPNTKLGELKAKIVVMMDLRKNGAVPQEIRNKNLNISATAKDVRELSEANSMEELQKRIQELERKNLRAQNLALTERDESITAEFTPVDPEPATSD